MQRYTIFFIIVDALFVSDVPVAVCAVLELLMMGGETARNKYSIDRNKEYCITLHLVGCT
jgi:hypothetical protein